MKNKELLDHIALLTNAIDYKLTQTPKSITFTFFYKTLAQSNRAIRLMQESGYPAARENMKSRTKANRPKEFIVSFRLSKEYNSHNFDSNLQNTTVKPKDSWEKHVYQKYSDYRINIPEDSNPLTKEELRKLRSMYNNKHNLDWRSLL